MRDSLNEIQSQDHFQYLEALQSPEVDAWITRHNAATESEYKTAPGFQDIYKEIYEVLSSKEKIPVPSLFGDWVYNFWRDENHDRGIWRRCKKVDFETGSPTWDILLDFDELSERDGKKWSYQGAVHSLDNRCRALVAMSEGGRDSSIWREFDVEKKTFVEGGFHTPEGKHRLAWLNENQVIACLTSEGWETTDAGYPMEARVLSRDGSMQPLYRGEKSDALLFAFTTEHEDKRYSFLMRFIDFHHSEMHWLRDGQLTKLDLPSDFRPYGCFKTGLLFQNNEAFERDGVTFDTGSLLWYSLADLNTIEVICPPPKRGSIEDAHVLRDRVLVLTLENVQSRASIFTREGKKWTSHSLNVGDFVTLTNLPIADPDPEESYLLRASFTSPPEILVFRKGAFITLPWKQKEWFKDESFQTRQEWAVSRDGTRVPYFVVSPKQLPPGTPRGALINAYGGFANSEVPYYLSTTGRAWLERGGTYILANIRGGAEFGPDWHKCAIKENRQRCYDDLIAVAEDALAKGISDKGHLGLMGGSNGGLLVGAILTQRPDLFGGFVCAMPLLDMLRYTELPPGSLWIAEYGDPKDPEAASYIRKYSPYQNIKSNATYPPTLFVTSTFDDRVHPGHARKMVAKLESMGHKPWFYEQRTGGHQLNDGLKEPAELQALEYAFLVRTLLRP